MKKKTTACPKLPKSKIVLHPIKLVDLPYIYSIQASPSEESELFDRAESLGWKLDLITGRYNKP